MKGEAIVKAIEALDKAISLRGSKVGACLYSRDSYYIGFNIENYVHKGYHAEEVAVINYLLNGKGEPQEGIVIVYSFKNHPNTIYPACGICRQLLWEYTNPNLLVTVVDKNGIILFEDTLYHLYPFAYPRL